MDSDFKGRHFQGEVILWAVRWYCKYGISYRELAEMLEERGVKASHTTIYRWVQHYAPELEKRIRSYRGWLSRSWRVDETYIKVKGRWRYLYRAIDSNGDTIDFYLSPTRNMKSAKRFLGKTLARLGSKNYPEVINTDKAGCYTGAITELKKENKLPEHTVHRQVKYLNNLIESDHGKLKSLIKPTLGFFSMKTAYRTIKGFEAMRMVKKGQIKFYQIRDGIKGEISFIERLFNLGQSAMAEALAVFKENAGDFEYGEINSLIR